MTIDWNGDTHCPYCEKPRAEDAQYDERACIEKEHGCDSKESVAYEEQFCWDYPEYVCDNYTEAYELAEETTDRRIRELLTERDMLRAQVRQPTFEVLDGAPSEYVYSTRGDTKDCDA